MNQNENERISELLLEPSSEKDVTPFDSNNKEYEDEEEEYEDEEEVSDHILTLNNLKKAVQEMQILLSLFALYLT